MREPDSQPEHTKPDLFPPWFHDEKDLASKLGESLHPKGLEASTLALQRSLDRLERTL
jgi:hypothetical protein